MNDFIDYLSVAVYTFCSCTFFISFEKSKIKAYKEKTYVNRWAFIAALLFLLNVVIRLTDMFWNDGELWGMSVKQRLFVGGAAVLLSVAFYVYVLFIALPTSTYGKTSETKLVSTGIYGRCRHPGAYGFALVALSLALLGGSWQLLVAAIFYSGLNLWYIYLQDVKYIPQYIEGYDEYKKEVPFLLFWKTTK